MEKTNCPRCATEIDADDVYCRRCGLRLKAPAAGELAFAEVVPEQRPAKPRFLDNRWLVLSMIFFILGPFGLPMLWQSQAFSRREKWVWTVLTALYVLFLCWLTYYLLVKMVFEPLSRLRF